MRKLSRTDGKRSNVHSGEDQKCLWGNRDLTRWKKDAAQGTTVMAMMRKLLDTVLGCALVLGLFISVSVAEVKRDSQTTCTKGSYDTSCKVDGKSQTCNCTSKCTTTTIETTCVNKACSSRTITAIKYEACTQKAARTSPGWKFKAPPAITKQQ